MPARTVQWSPIISQMSLAAGLVLGASLLLGCFLASIALGMADIGPGEVFQALTHSDGSTEHLIIRTVRIPRAITALLVGAVVAVVGAIMQGLTRNPLADPGILGINAGAALAVVMAVFWLNAVSLSVYAGFALVGAAVAAYRLGLLGRGGLTPLNLTIAGAALTALVSSLTTGILILRQRTLEEIRSHIVRFWAGADYRWILPYSALVGAILVLLADIGARLSIQPQELPVGIVMLLLGAPIFIYLTRSQVRR